MVNFLKHIHPLLRRKKSGKDYEDVNYAIIQSLKTELEDTEDEAVKSKIQSSLKYATEKYLDTYGDWFGVYRLEDETDTHYRQRIIDYVLLKRGTNKAITEALKNYLEDYESKISIYEPYTNIFYTNKSFTNGKDKLMGFYYRFAVIDITVGRPFPSGVIDIINSFKPAGVTFYLTYDGSYQMGEDNIIKLPSTDFDIDWYTTTDVFDGYGLLSYGHLNLGNKKTGKAIIYDPEQGKFVNIFRTNHSKTNSKDLLSGDPSVGKIYYNTGYNSTASYTPEHNHNSSTIAQQLGERVIELDYDFYAYTDKLDRKPAKYDITGNNSIENFYMSLDIYKFYQDNYPNGIEGKSQKEIVQYIKENTKKPKLAFSTRGLLEPNDRNYMEMQVYNFTLGKWEKLYTGNLTITWEDNKLELGNMFDFISNNGLVFLDLTLNTREPFVFELDYLDLYFEYREDDVYTIKPFLGNISWETYTDMGAFIKYFKLASLDRGDIITKSGYQPMQYLRLTDGYDNNINRNLLHNITQGFYYDSYGFTYNGYKTTVDGREAIAWSDTSNIISLRYNGTDLVPGEKYTLSFYAKASKELKLQRVYLNAANTNFLPNQVINTKWNRYSFTFIAKDDGKDNKVTFHSYPEVNNGEKIFYLSDMKLEFGDKATKVQPNPEDIYGANDPNRYVELQAKDKDNNNIPNKPVARYETKQGMNLIADKDIIKNTSKGSYVQGDTKELTMSLWGTRITQSGAMEKKLKEGKTYTISYDMEMLEVPTVPGYRQAPGIIVYTRNPTTVIAETRYVNGYAQVRDLPVGTKERVELTFTMPYVGNVELTAYTGLFNETGEASPYETREYSKVKFTDIKLEAGSTATPYKPSPEDIVSFLDKTVKFSGVYNNMQSIGILNSIDLPETDIQYSVYGEEYTELKKLSKLTKGETYTDNNLVDLYGLNYVKYKEFTIMSNILLGKIFDKKLNDITSIPGEFLNMPNDFFNATWTTTIYDGEVSLNGLNIVKDSINGYIDNSTGIITRMNLFKAITEDTITTISDSIETHIEEPITMGTDIAFNDVYDLPLSTENITIEKGIKVIQE